MVAKKPQVVAAESMDDHTFFLHFNKRHTPVAGLAKTRENVSDGVVATMRTYHDRVHREEREDGPTWRPVNHEHGAPKRKKGGKR